ncbi:MAG TPA: efflux RND transporter periplasmic adaptor subunit [Pyrinomonadaceae bacterium]|nr:efflux RND transporter periplasmic adaptor subunit [Pyrinomonadaceae bacterium]
MALSRKKKIIIAVSAVVLLLLIVIISVVASRKDEPEVTTVKIDVRPELRSTVTASGEVRPIQYIKLTSEVPGRILEIFVNAGDIVKKGQQLVRVDPTQLQSSQEAQFASTQAFINDVQSARNAVASAQQGLVVAEAAVSQARQQTVSADIDLKTAERELKRATNLVEANVMSRSEYDAAHDRYDQAKAKLEAQNIAVKEAIERANQQRVAVKEAQTSVKSSEARANQQQALLRGQSSQREKATQYSPLNGVVADIPTRVGEFAVAGLSTTPLMTIADMNTINVEVNVDETEVNNVEVGQQAKVKVDALGEKEIKATVILKNPLAIAKSDTTGGLSNRVNVQEAKEFKVTLELDKSMPDEIRTALRPGMSATATITTKTKTNVIAVPLQAIVEKAPPTPTPGPSIASSAPTPQGEKVKEQKGVYVLDKANKVKFVEVTTGITGESDIEVTSGLQAGAEVVTGPSRVLKTLKDGASVKRQPRASAANANAGGN